MGDYNRVIISGSSPGGAENWSVGLAYGGPASTSIIQFQDQLNAWAAAVGTYLTGLATSNVLITMLSSEGAITSVRTEYRDTTGILLAAGEAPISKSGAGTASKALQVSCVVSLRTAFPGRSYRGRMYWPAWAYTPSSGLQFGTSLRTDMLAAFKALNAAVIAAGVTALPAYTGDLVVRSATLQAETEVIRAEVGSVPDTQRRRRDLMPEVYSAVAIP